VFKRVLRYQFWKGTTFSPFRTQRDANLKFINLKIILKFGWRCGPFALGQYFLPLWHESPKTDTLKWNIGPFLSLPFGKQLKYSIEIEIWVKIIPKWRTMRNTGKEWIIPMELSGSVFFAEYSISLSILWLSMRIYLKTH
jgi:hypothetical protein